jgi:phosphopentomutase
VDRGLLKTEELRKKFDYEIENFKVASDCFDRGSAILDEVIATVPERKRDGARRIMGIGKFIANTARTAANIKEFFKRKSVLRDLHGEERNRVVDEMLEICKREMENARATVPLVEFDSRLGYEPSMEYMCDAAHLEWKIELLRQVIEDELPSYYER